MLSDPSTDGKKEQQGSVDSQDQLGDIVEHDSEPAGEEEVVKLSLPVSGEEAFDKSAVVKPVDHDAELEDWEDKLEEHSARPKSHVQDWLDL